jgi:hypothetical protein
VHSNYSKQSCSKGRFPLLKRIPENFLWTKPSLCNPLLSLQLPRPYLHALDLKHALQRRKQLNWQVSGAWLRKWP